ncbi:MAG: HAD family hydrolase [Clostridiales bacterium]|jgi:phosphoglycolate phosphatase|nr:HAD family hydrolase [Clostridiales bacterium]
MYKCAIFDLDGTLLNTLPDLTDCVNQTLRHFGLPERKSEEIMAFLGSGRTHLIRSASGIDTQPRLEEICVWYDACYGANYRHLTHAYDGIADALEQVQAAGIKMAVLSNKQHEMTVPLVAECLPGIRFGAVFGQRPNVALKPEAGAVTEILDALGCTRDECIYFGDSDVDVRTARNAGVEMVAVTWGFRSVETLRKAGAVRFIHTPAEIPGVFCEASGVRRQASGDAGGAGSQC